MSSQSLIQNLLRIKAELLCWGIRSGDDLDKAFIRQNPFLDRRTGNAGLQILLKGFVINVPVHQKFTESSPYEIKEINGELVLAKNGEFASDFQLIKFPSWYEAKTSDGTPLPKVLIQEGRHTLVTDIYNVCDFFKTEGQCGFCAIAPYAKIKLRSPDNIVEAVLRALEDNPGYSLHLTGGCTFEQDKGILNYIDIVQSLRKFTSIPICIETAPPDSTDYLDLIVDAGANAFSINLEIYDDHLRKIFCPEKSKITKDKYIETWQHLLNLTGPNSVTSALIAGLERPESTVMGAELIAETGVIPTILPFRPNDKSLMRNFRRTSPDEVLGISSEVGMIMLRNDIVTLNQPGCLDCRACTLEIDFQYSVHNFEDCNEIP